MRIKIESPRWPEDYGQGAYRGKAALYARCSTRKQDLDSQIMALTDWAKKEGYKYKIFTDLAISGRKDDRKGINELMDAATKKEINTVGVLEISRIGRSIGFIHKVIEKLSSLSIKCVLVRNNTVLDYTTLEGRALIGGLALAADIEWMLIKERNERGRKAILERGIKVGRKHKEVSLEAIKALQEKGLSLRQIGNELGVSAPTIMRRLEVTKLGKSETLQESQENDEKDTQSSG